MDSVLQNALVLTVVVAASAYLARVAWQSLVRRKNAGCGSGCPSCSARASEPQTMGIAPLTKEPVRSAE